MARTSAYGKGSSATGRRTGSACITSTASIARRTGTWTPCRRVSGQQFLARLIEVLNCPAPGFGARLCQQSLGEQRPNVVAHVSERFPELCCKLDGREALIGIAR